jgi:hypothetical protein
MVVLESYKQSQMPLSDALSRMESYQRKYPNLQMWGDPARKQLYMEMAIRFGEGSVVNPAEKEQKHDNIELMNHDFALGQIKIVKPENAMYIAELKSLRKLIKTTIQDAALNEERAGKWIEHPKLANDICDCGLYTWRQSRHYRHQPVIPGPKPGTPEYAQEMAREIWQQEASARKEKRAWWKRN